MTFNGMPLKMHLGVFLKLFQAYAFFGFCSCNMIEILIKKTL